jgi:hypothetical protein
MSSTDNSSADESHAERLRQIRKDVLETVNAAQAEADAKIEAIQARVNAELMSGQTARDSARARVIRSIVSLASAFIFIGCAFAIYLYSQNSLALLDSLRSPIVALGLLGMFIGASGLMVLGVYKAKADITFLDIDSRRASNQKNASAPNIEEQRLRDAYFEYVPGKPNPVAQANATADIFRTPFEQHLIFTIGSLNERMRITDMKSSHLLDRGTMYIKNGIIFYVVSILLFQIAGHYIGVSNLMVAGMASCSLLFLVIEFLATWFLKQYKAFVDASTNLLRVISIYNSILLSYHGIKEFAPTDEGRGDKMRKEILEILSREIKWPQPTQVKGGDASHMVEMFDSLGLFMERAKGVFQKPAPKAAEEEAV